jgi:DNA topoisomerase IB
VRLRRSDPNEPGLRRRRRGKGWSYTDVQGQPVDEATRERITALVIPPAWQDVWICPHATGHIQAVGTDDAGRRQYLYHDQWRLERDEAKHDRVLRLARRLPEIRATTESDLRARGLGRDRVLAAGLRMLDHGVFRVGGDQYAQEHGTQGVATLSRDNVRVTRGEVIAEFTAKGGLERVVVLPDALLAKTVTALKRSRSGMERLLVFRDGDGYHEVHAEDLNERFKELAGEDFTVKDLRTWQATVVAAVELAQVDLPRSKTGVQRAERAAMEQVGEQLGNTPAVARRSYVDPRVVDGFEDEVTIEPALDRIGVEAVDDLADPDTRLAVERSVVRLLTRR